jgi:hypothetical protein
MVVLRALAACAGLILAGFHVWLLGQQAWTGRLERPASQSRSPVQHSAWRWH